MATAIITPNEVEQIVSPLVAQVLQMVIQDGEDYEFACALLQKIAQRKKQVAEVFDPIVGKAHEAHKEAVAQKNRFLKPLEESEGSIKRIAGAYLNERERIRRAEEQRQADALRKQQDADAAAEAARLRESGETHMAEIVEMQAAEAPAPVVVIPPSVPKIDGVSKRKEWKFRIIDETKIPREYLMVNEKAIGAMVRAQKGLCRIPGVEVYSEDNLAVRA